MMRTVSALTMRVDRPRSRNMKYMPENRLTMMANKMTSMTISENMYCARVVIGSSFKAPDVWQF